MSKLFQIYDHDLTELERLIPEITIAFDEHLTPRIRTQLRRVKDILSNVRWDYGPHTVVEVIPSE